MRPEPRENRPFFGFPVLGFVQSSLGFGVVASKYPSKQAPEVRYPRAKQVLVAAVILLTLGGLIVLALTGWRHLPEIWADWIGMMVGIMSTPFFLEASFIFIGLSIVVAINHWRQKRAGDDFVEVEAKNPEE